MQLVADAKRVYCFIHHDTCILEALVLCIDLTHQKDPTPANQTMKGIAGHHHAEMHPLRDVFL